MAAGLATMKIYKSEPVVETLHRQGNRLAAGVRQVAERHGVSKHVTVAGRGCNLFYGTTDGDGKPSQAFRSLFLQEIIKRGVIGPSWVVSYSHTDADIDRTIEAVDGALAVYAQALSEGVEKLLVGPPSRPVFGRR
jgi:glutamate-1-semialdehyde 2,1-aminomutase